MFFINSLDENFDSENNEENIVLADSLFEEYDDEAIFESIFNYLKNNSDSPQKIINFLNLFYYYSFSNIEISNPYPFFAYLLIKYNNFKSDLDYDLILIIALNLLENSCIINPYLEDYNPSNDEYLQNEIKKNCFNERWKKINLL